MERYAAEIAVNLKKKIEGNVLFVSPRFIHPNNEWLAKELEVLKIGKFKGYWWEQVELPMWLLRNNNPVLFNPANLAPILYGKSILTLHDIAFRKYPEWFSWPFQMFYNLVIPFLLRRAIKVVTVSRFSKDEIISEFKIDSDKIDVIFNGVTRFGKSEKPDIKLQKPFLLLLGSADPRKNIKAVVESLNNNIEGKYDLIITGKASGVFSDTDYENYSNVRFTGYIEDAKLAWLYRNAEALIYPSIYEGFGLPVLEALDNDCRVICSDIPVFRELFQGFVHFFSLERPEEITDLLKDIVLRENTEKMDLKNIYSWEKSSLEIYNLMNKFA